MLAWSGSATLAPAGVRVPRSHSNRTINTILVHTLRNRGGAEVVTWTLRRGRIAIAFKGSTDVGVVQGRTLTYWSQGRRTDVIRYHFEGLWRALSIRFGVSQEVVSRSLSSSANLLRLASPLAHAAGAKGQPTPLLTSAENYADHIAALARNAPFPIRYAGAAVLGYRLADTSISIVHDPARHTVSGPIAVIVYSSNPAALGARDHQLTLNFADRASQAGQANETFIGRGRPTVKAGGVVAYKANENQVVFELGRAIGVITSTLPLTNGQWRTVLSALRAP